VSTYQVPVMVTWHTHPMDSEQMANFLSAHLTGTHGGPPQPFIEAIDGIPADPDDPNSPPVPAQEVK
jgi:hypothetical protein